MGKPIDWQAETAKRGLWDWDDMRARVCDAETAKAIGCPKNTVTKARARLDIAPARKYGSRRPEMRISHPDLEWSFVIPGVWDMEKKVARMPDDALGLMMKCTTREVITRRTLAGVRPFPEIM